MQWMAIQLPVQTTGYPLEVYSIFPKPYVVALRSKHKGHHSAKDSICFICCGQKNAVGFTVEQTSTPRLLLRATEVHTRVNKCSLYSAAATEHGIL